MSEADTSNTLESLEVEASVEDDVVAVRMTDPNTEVGMMLAFPNDGEDRLESINMMLNIFPQALQSILAQMEAAQ